jgi:copper chaperone CopZ
MIREILHLHQLRTDHDRRAVQAALTPLAGLSNISFNLADRTVRFEREPRLGLSTILAALAAAGYTADVLA